MEIAMLRKLLGLAIVLANFNHCAFAQTEFTATLAGHAVLPVTCPLETYH